MTAPLVVMDVGDVLVRTVPMAHYRELARRTGIKWEQIAQTIEDSGIVSAFESGQVTPLGVLSGWTSRVGPRIGQAVLDLAV